MEHRTDELVRVEMGTAGPDENYSKKKVDVLLVHYQGTEPVHKIL